MGKTGINYLISTKIMKKRMQTYTKCGILKNKPKNKKLSYKEETHEEFKDKSDYSFITSGIDWDGCIHYRFGVVEAIGRCRK